MGRQISHLIGKLNSNYVNAPYVLTYPGRLENTGNDAVLAWSWDCAQMIGSDRLWTSVFLFGMCHDCLHCKCNCTIDWL